METTKPAELNVWQILKQSVILYRQNIPILIAISSLSFIGFLIEYGLKLLNYRNIWLNSLLLLLIYSWVYFALYVAIFGAINNEVLQYKQIILSPKKVCWRFVKTIILLGLISLGFVTPVILAIAVMILLQISPTISNIIVLGAMAIIFLYLYTLYYFVPLIILVENQDTKALKISRQLISSRFWSIFSLVLVAGAIVVGPYLLFKILHVYLHFPRVLILLFSSLTSIIVLPFATINTVLAYREISDKR